MITFPLSKPIIAHGAELSELTLERPSTEQIIRLGLPYKIVLEDSSLVMIPSVIAKYIVVLAKIPASSVNNLHPADFMKLQTEMLPFFAPAGGEDEDQTNYLN